MPEPELAGIEVIGEGDDLTDAALPDFMRGLSRPRLHRDAALTPDWKAGAGGIYPAG